MTDYKLPLGLRDYVGTTAENKAQIEAYLLDLFNKLGYKQIQTPLLEYQEVFAKYSLTNEDFYRVLGPRGEIMVLRPDLTLPIARFLATTNISLPQKFAYIGSVFKQKRELMGFSNQEVQAGVELIGYDNLKAELECLYLINRLNRKLFGGELYLELGNATFASKVLAKLDIEPKTQTAIKQALFTKNLPTYERLIAPYQQQELFAFLKIWPRLFGTIAEVSDSLLQAFLPADLKKEWQKLLDLATLVAKLPNQEVRLDLTSLAPQEYYTGLTFKAYSPTKAAYLVSGGRYDKLLTNFQAKKIPAVGLGIDLDLMAQLLTKNTTNSKLIQVYFKQEQLAEVATLIEHHENLTFSLAESLDEAKIIAKNQAADLKILTEKGELVDVTEDSTN